MAVADIMTKNLITVSPDDTVDEMRHLLQRHNIHHLLVIKDGVLLGVISDRDILKTLSPYVGTKVETDKDTFTLTRKAQQIMRRKTITIKSNASIQEAAKCLIDNKVSLLPVVDENGITVGVLSWKDVLRFLID